MRRFVVANRLRFGTIDPADDDPENVPFYKRFFLGGATSLRGWGRFEVSPLSGFGFPIGGLSMAEGATEVRFPLFGKLGGVLFADYGNVWSDAWSFDARDLKLAVGPGLRYQTPIGPARVDFGYQVTPIEGLRVEGKEPDEQRHWRVHFSIGQAF
jgi:outer membrane protein insertion porin family/translocation and assembly module TamA